MIEIAFRLWFIGLAIAAAINMLVCIRRGYVLILRNLDPDGGIWREHEPRAFWALISLHGAIALWFVWMAFLKF